MADDFFTIQHLDYTYENQAILHDLNLAMSAGECVALLGPSGVGKSTLLHIIAGLLPANKGTISLQEDVITEKGQHIIPCENRGIGMMFQDFALFPQMRVNTNIAFGLQQHGYSAEATKRRVQELLSLMYMEDLGQRYPHELSGGQQQRVALARALAIQPKLLLLDEPFANIDTSLRVRLHAELQRTITERQLSVLLVTHDRQEAFALANRVGIVVPTANGARIAQLASPQEVYQRPQSVLIAQLTGSVNLFSGYLENEWVETTLGKWPCQGSHQGAGIVATRPEQLEFIPEASGQARIFSKHFMGAGYRLIVESEVGMLMVDAPLSPLLNIGDNGNIHLKQPAWFIGE